MLSHENAKLLGDVTPGAPMHDVFRRFWLPVMTSGKLEPGGAPVKFTLLCRNYVAFRAQDGRVAVLDEKCPHRGCSLAIAHARDDSLICIFHGWKFHVSGRCVETPNMANPDFPKYVPLKSYPARDAGGAIWVYVGDGAAPDFVDLVFNRLGSDRLCSRRAVCEFNWLTGLEAILDPSHVGVLHSTWIEAAPNQGTSVDFKISGAHLAPRLEFENTDYGFRYATIRDLPEAKMYLRVSEYVLPSGVFIPVSQPGRRLFIMSVPIDNYRSMQWYFRHSPEEPMSDEDRSWAIGRSDPDDNDFYQSPKGKPNWGQDRAAMQRGESFTGFTDIMFEDFIAGESQGAWPDRTKEFIGPADAAIVHARNYLLAWLRAGGGGSTLAPPANDALATVQAIAAVLPGDVDWRAAAAQARRERAPMIATLPALPRAS
jgi:phenylpropionate dioxygenase-like ring-hydroxylating dioxygenase large terminal subunit